MKRIIFYDGICPLCNKFVLFCLNHNEKKQFLFSSLQSSKAIASLNTQDLSLGSIVLLEDQKKYYKSTAVLRILFYIGSWWTILSLVFSIFPVFIRDSIYDLVAKNRYRFFGKYDVCPLPTPEQKTFFVE